MGAPKETRMTRLFFGVLAIQAALALPFAAGEALAQGGGGVANTAYGRAIQYQPNTVRVIPHPAAPGGAEPDQGVGIVLGERGGKLYIATAAHVVWGRSGNIAALSAAPSVEFFEDQGHRYPAERLDNQLSAQDLAVLVVTKPAGITLVAEPPVDPGQIQPPAPITDIRALANWDIQASPAFYKGIDLPTNLLLTEALNTPPGTSGAPVLTSDGLLGMVLRSGFGESSSLLRIGSIADAFRTWNYPLTYLGQTRTAPRVAQIPDAEEMAVIPAGHFTMGSSSAETTRETVPDSEAVWERPQHDVKLKSFLLAKHAVTRGEFGKFVAETNYSAKGCYSWDGSKWNMSATASWQSPGFEQTDQHPVVCVSHDDAEAYIKWYSQKTGRVYRLPSEAEWEYAARAGTATARYWGDSSTGQCDYANGPDLTAKDKYSGWTVADCRDGYVYTAPVGSFRANAWGLYDMLGNVWQWTSDCWNESYTGAPLDGSAWTTGNCGWRVVRGGSWRDYPRNLRSAVRNWSDAGLRNYIAGFRLARTLP
jgi:sulfatase modifying factor 1